MDDVARRSRSSSASLQPAAAARSSSSSSSLNLTAEAKKKRDSLDAKRALETEAATTKTRLKGPRESKDPNPRKLAKNNVASSSMVNLAKPLREWNDETERILDLDLEDGPFTKTVTSGAAGRVRHGKFTYPTF